MDFDSEQLRDLRTKRILRLQAMLDDQKKQIADILKSGSQSLLNNKKYRQYRKVLEQRIRMAQNFIRYVTDTFFCMVTDYQFLFVTTQMYDNLSIRRDLNEKVTRFKKGVQSAWQKLSHNLEGEIEEKQVRQMPKHKKQDDQEQIQEEPVGRHNYRSAPKANRGKNFKISNEATLGMMEWLLRHFDNPYPTNQDKQRMAREGNISLVKVNNWFINARERTVKSYLYRDN